MRRWWIYQKERFPLAAHGPLIAAFSSSAVAFSSMLRAAPVPEWQVFGTAFGVCLLMFLQLRVADEFKDKEEDARWRPYRPVPRGLVTLRELRVVFVLASLLQAVLALALDARLMGVLAVAWLYLALMSVEFFQREWLKARPIAYLLTHMGIMPLVDFFGTACEWLPDGGSVPPGLGWFLTASFFNGIVIETGRKLRQPGDEEEGVETYSRLWGKCGGAAAWMGALAVTFVCAGLAAAQIGFVVPVIACLGLMFAGSAVVSIAYLRGSMHGKRLEMTTGLWTLALYFLLGPIALYFRH